LKNRRWLNIVKWAWVLIVTAGIITYFVRNHETLLAHIRNVSVPYLLLSMALLAGGKILMTRLSIHSLWEQPWKPAFSKMFYIYSMMQLAKYLPGGIWHFVGRFGVYRANGLNNKQAGKSILVENIWLVSSAIFFGVGAIILFQRSAVLSFISIPDDPWIQAGLITGIAIIWVVSYFIVNQIVFREANQPVKVLLTLIATQVLAWLCIGAGFWVPLLAISPDLSLAGIAIGSFVLSWAAGYLTVFAPSGFGIREAVLVFLLGGIISPEVAVVYAAVNRFSWIAVEVILGIISELVFGSGKLSTLLRPRRDVTMGTSKD
jgi:hypothetical protein